MKSETEEASERPTPYKENNLTQNVVLPRLTTGLCARKLNICCKQKMKFCKNAQLTDHTEHLYVSAKIWKSPTCPLPEEQIL